MPETVIRIERLSKQYRLGVINHGRLSRDLQSWWARVRGVEDPNSRVDGAGLGRSSPGIDRFWALRDISFDVQRGDRVGIVGQNGAGKSTLLKILSRVTAPTEGIIKVKGRVASLLEVGTGFSPELTGRENIFLNGAILGMRKTEVRRKFDEIVSFAEVEKFIDTPVKRYSSGMYVRLAFAVAAHLEPDILVVDEVLAVGDIAFQRKCLGKMEEVSRTEGRTILFVSHNLQAVRTICDRAILLVSGRMELDGGTESVLSAYGQTLRNLRIDESALVGDASRRRGSGQIRITSVSVQNVSGEESFHFAMGDTIRISVSYKVLEDLKGCALYIGLRSSATNELVTSVRHVISDLRLPAGFVGTATVELPDVFLRPGEYPFYFHVSEASLESRKFDVLDDATHPLVISPGDRKLFANYEPEQTVGYFSLPSRLIQSEPVGR